MGFLDKLFKKSNSNNEDAKVDNNDSPDISNNEVTELSILSFNEFNNLIHSSKYEISVNSNIVLSDFELNIFSQGIQIDVDGIVIDGNNNSITSNKRSRIFNITAKNVIIKNFNLKNGFDPEFGAAIFIQEGASCIIENCSFKNHESYAGGAILNNGDLVIKNSKFDSNISEYSGGAITNMGKLDVDDSQFSSNQSMGGGAIHNHYGAVLKISNSELIFNKANQGGAIISFSKFDVKQTRFNGNSAKYGGGAINSSEKSSLFVSDCKFTDNEAIDGGAILNMGETNIYNAQFEGNHSLISGGCIHNLDIINIEDCEFVYNNSDTDAGAIYGNGGSLNLKNSKFIDNSAYKQGGALVLQGGSTYIFNIQCMSNHAPVGGALLNFGKTKVTNSKFENNEANIGSTIDNEGSASLEISKTEFIKNSLESKGNVIFNDAEIKFLNCNFSQNKTGSTIISNNSNMTCVDSIFEDNTAALVINNQDDSIIEILGGKFINNFSTISTICNSGESCIINKLIFKGNSSDKENCNDIYNKTNLFIQNPRFEDTAITIFNKGYIDAHQVFCDDLMPHIENQGTIDCISKDQNIEFNFLELDNLIHESNTGKIILEKDISIGIYELDFYEGGIDLDIDNLVIDGQGKVIDGDSRSRIFNVCGKNITLKNIIFKNGHLFNRYEENSTGGGVIKVSKGASLIIEDCKFENNYSEDKGGVILNNGELYVINSIFENNNSKTYGGAIFNQDTLKLENCNFKNNKSEIAGAIFNNKKLYLGNNKFYDNQSNIVQPVYNNDFIQTDVNIDDLIYNVGELNKKMDNIESFTYLNTQIRQNNEIKLNYDIKFDNKVDSEFRNGIEIENDLMIDGNGHIIDGANFASMFTIVKDNINVTFKNITFKNAYSTTKSLIENKGSLTLENCKFINNKSCNVTNLIDNENSLKIIDSIFSGNSCNKDSLINNFKEVEIINSIFIINSSKSSGTVLSNNIPKLNEELKWLSKISIINSRFDSNHSLVGGGAIYNGSWSILDVIDTSFINNRVYVSAGAIINSGKLNLNQCCFKNNNAKYGGAIYSTGSLNISNTEFSNNNSSQGGGAIENLGRFILKDSSFENNYAKHFGGALFTEHSGSISISNAKFINNCAHEEGGAIFIQDGRDKFSVDSSVEGIHASNYTKVDINNSKFINNASKNNGGAINNQKNTILELSDSEFIENESENMGGAISSFGSLKIISSKFNQNKATKDAGAIVTSNEVVTEHCEFNENTPNDIKQLH